MSETEAAETKSALLNHCITIYDAMMDKSEEYLDEDYPEGEAPRLYVGMLTKLFVRMDYGISNYSRIVTTMQDMGCIEQIRRGAGRTPGMWLLWRRPNEELFQWVKTYNQKKDKQENILADSTEQRIRDLQTAVGDLQTAIQNHEERLDVLEDD